MVTAIERRLAHRLHREGFPKRGKSKRSDGAGKAANRKPDVGPVKRGMPLACVPGSGSATMP